MRAPTHQRLVEQLQIELRDERRQRDKLQGQLESLAEDMIRLNGKREKQEKEIAAERISTATHIRVIEDRAHAEVDRARTEAKTLRAMLDQAERSRRTAEQTAVKEHREHANQLRAAEREASAQRARAEVLESQIKRLGNALPAALPTARRGARRKKQTVDPLTELREYFEAMVTRMRTPEARAAGEALSVATGREIGIDAVAQAAKDRKSKRK